MLSAHAFSNHEHAICSSKVESHLHQKNLDCDLHLIKLQNGFLPEKINKANIEKNPDLTPILTYNFLKNHHQLSFSLRGPPIIF